VEAARSSFEEVVEAITEHTGAQVPTRQAEELCQRAAQDVDAFYAQRRAQPQESPAAAAGSIVVRTTDGKGVPMRTEALRPQTRKGGGGQHAEAPYTPLHGREAAPQAQGHGRLRL
jgi:hypothetical protein